jgi:hypothetical protein
MKRTFGNEECWLTVVSRGRWKNVPVMEAKIGPATWYVPEREIPFYVIAAEQGSEFRVADEYPESRNVALKEGWAKDITVVQMDDDLKGFKLAIDGKAIETDTETALTELLETLALSDYRLGGLAPTANAFFSSDQKPVSSNLFICGQCFAVKPCDLLFDGTMRLKADYDYTIRHWQAYGGVCRLNLVLPEFAHYGNPGGCVEYRTSELMQEANRTLTSRYPDYVKKNARRGDDEILLKLPRRARGLP